MYVYMILMMSKEESTKPRGLSTTIGWSKIRINKKSLLAPRHRKTKGTFAELRV